jgi:hypothetical protein
MDEGTMGDCLKIVASGSCLYDLYNICRAFNTLNDHAVTALDEASMPDIFEDCPITLSPFLHEPTTMLFSVKGFLGYGSPRGLIDESQRPEREESPTHGQKRDAEPPEMAEMKRIKLSEQIAAAADIREKASPKERSSMDSRRKDAVKGEKKPGVARALYSTSTTSRAYKSRSIRRIRTASPSMGTMGTTTNAGSKA